MCVGVYVFRYAALCLVLVVPEAVSVMRTLWGSTLLVSGSLRHWPPLHVTLLVMYRCRRRRRCRCLLWPSLMYSFSRTVSVSLFIHTTLHLDITSTADLLQANYLFTNVISLRFQADFFLSGCLRKSVIFFLVFSYSN